MDGNDFMEDLLLTTNNEKYIQKFLAAILPYSIVILPEYQIWRIFTPGEAQLNRLGLWGETLSLP